MADFIRLPNNSGIKTLISRLNPMMIPIIRGSTPALDKLLFRIKLRLARINHTRKGNKKVKYSKINQLTFFRAKNHMGLEIKIAGIANITKVKENHCIFIPPFNLINVCVL